MTDGRFRPRILVIDDAAYNREVLVQNLEDEYELLEASDGLTGFCIARDEQPDIILMDLWLPGVDGWEATRRLRRDPRTAWIPIVAVTAHAMAGADAGALASGCDDYLAKPVDEQLLLVKVREWIARGRLRL
jgi:two-component system, cell cycle response regulator DivK